MSIIAKFGKMALKNFIGRKYLSKEVHRSIFSTGSKLPYNIEEDVLPTFQYHLDKNNYLDALQASGAIPLIMNGVPDISGAANGIYWDGAMTDYHISLPYHHHKGLVLVPHFYDKILSGWFDKKMPWYRRPAEINLDNVLLLSPSKEFVASLPLKRIPEMNDFKRFGSNQKARRNYWMEIADRSEILAEEFEQLINQGTLVDRLESI
jgi:hypothetical protein